ncbi:MAG: class I SAM-dependent rRNA methyltransferase [Erysipelotrichales bacterium]|nr:class I SAM-dependent rRNA methyltransferase [Erysipelotrichales bacterium]
MEKKLIIDETGARYLMSGQVWCYANNVLEVQGNPENGDITALCTKGGNLIGYGFYSAVNHIRARILSRNAQTVPDAGFFRERIKKAVAYRKTIMGENFSNCRLIFGESDGLPGWVVDRYNDVLVSQISTAGIEKRKEELYGFLVELLKETGEESFCIYERNEIVARAKEGLPSYKGFYNDAVHAENTVILENGIYMNVDFVHGQKTGYFLDQKTNRLITRNYAKGKRVLDAFTHTGGFAMNCAYGGAASVVAADLSKTALEQAKQNARLNHLENVITFVQTDVLRYLDDCKPDTFDMIILDPPAFTKSRRTVDHAYQGYKRINLRAMELLPDGGILATCSCSRYMETELFEKMLEEASAEAGVKLIPLSVTYQNPDHPVLPEIRSTEYLKFLVFRVEKQKD